MQVHELIQGTPEWAAHRASHFNASDAPAMMGCSPYKTRAQLLHEMHTGMAPEVDAATQRRFDDGHRFEALARPIAEQIIGEDLYPVVGSEGKYSASFDGLNITDEIGFEHKSLNYDLCEVIVEGCTGADLPLHYRVQLEQQCMVSACARILFMASQWRGNELVEERHCWYYPDAELREKIVAGWSQFAEDLKTYTQPAAAPVVVAEAVQALPAVLVQVSGEIMVKDNFKTFETALRDFLDHRLIREPKTDQDFADLDLQIKAMKGAEEALAGAEAQMLAQVQSIDQAKKTKDMLAKLVRDNRLMAEKLLASEKERRRGEIVAGGIAAFKAHIDGMNQRLGKPYMPTVPADFGGAVKGLKSMTSMENAVATELARVKIEASQIADKIEVNLKWLRENATEYAHLFADTGTLVLKAPDDFRAVAENRISTEKQRVQAEQDRIREEAAAKARQDLIDEQAALHAKAAAPAASPAHVAKPAIIIDGPFTSDSPVPQFDNSARIKLGEINARISPLIITAAGLAELGFQPAGKEGTATMFLESDYPRICEALIQHITQVADLQPA